MPPDSDSDIGTSICLLAHDGRTMPSTNSAVAVVDPQRWVTAATVGHGCSRGSRPSCAYPRVEPPSRLMWRKDTSGTVFIVRLAHTESICSLVGDGITMPSASSTVAVVESQRRTNRGRRSLKGEPPFECTSASSLYCAWPITRLYARRLGTAVPCRQRAVQSPLWSHNGGATASTLDRGRLRGSRPSCA